MQLARIMFLFSIVCISIVTLSNAHWEGRLTAADETLILELPRSPVWSPPAIPSYQELRGTLHTLSATAQSATKRRVFRADLTLFDFGLYLWADTFVFGFLYLCFRRDARDPVLHSAASLAATFTGAAIVGFALYVLLGGFIDPLPQILAGAAIVVGLLIAWSTYAPKLG
jgi:hypothetical protein